MDFLKGELNSLYWKKNSDLKKNKLEGGIKGIGKIFINFLKNFFELLVIMKVKEGC